MSTGKGQVGKHSITSRETTGHGLLQRWKNVTASPCPQLFLVSKTCISGGGSSVSPIPEHRQICRMLLLTSTARLRASGPPSLTHGGCWCARGCTTAGLTICNNLHVSLHLIDSVPFQSQLKLYLFFSPPLLVTLLFSPSYCLCCYS